MPIAAVVIAWENVAVGLRGHRLFWQLLGSHLAIIQVTSSAVLASKGPDQQLGILCSLSTLCWNSLLTSNMISSQHFSASRGKKVKNEPWGQDQQSMSAIKDEPEHHWFSDHLFFFRQVFVPYVFLVLFGFFFPPCQLVMTPKEYIFPVGLH